MIKKQEQGQEQRDRNDHEIKMQVNSWPSLLYRAIKELGIPTVLASGLIYIIYIVGIKLVVAHEQYLRDTATLFKSNADQVIQLVELNKQQAQIMRAISSSNIEVRELLKKDIGISEENLKLNKQNEHYHEKSIEILKKIEIQQILPPK